MSGTRPPDLAAGLAAALLFARGRPEGTQLLANDAPTALHSFRAAWLCLPIFVSLRLLTWSLQGPPSGGVALALVAEGLGFAISWMGFALLSKPLAEQARRGEQWFRFIAAWNWANVIQYVVLLSLMLPSAFGVPPWLANGLGLAALGYAVWLEWFVTRAALGVAGPTAVMFVLLDLALGLFIGGAASRIAG
ncbi:MAG: hypothetical protein K2X11_13055 [Acetobacteraceae bacterium]|nr:hypothetical protein [Acetobacteraceae bacterium]